MCLAEGLQELLVGWYSLDGGGGLVLVSHFEEERLASI